jgi:hypothetical protein
MQQHRPLPAGFTKEIIERLSQKEFAVILANYGFEQIGVRCGWSDSLINQVLQSIKEK